MKNCVNLNIQILPRMYLVMWKKKIRKKTFNRKEMVGEIQSPVIVFPNRDKEQLNTHIGSENSISLLRKDVLSIQKPPFYQVRCACQPKKKKSPRIPPLLRELWPLKIWYFLKISTKYRFQL